MWIWAEERKTLELHVCSKNQNSIFFKASSERYVAKSFLKMGIGVYLTGGVGAKTHSDLKQQHWSSTPY